MDNVTTLITLLGEDNVDEIKRVIKDELIDNIREAIQSEWVLMPYDIEEEFKTIMQEESDKLLKAYRKEIKEALKAKYAEWVEQLKEE